MGRVVKYEVVKPHYCPDCDRMIGQTTKTRAWIRKAFDACGYCQTAASVLLLDAYRDDLQVVYIEGTTRDEI
jgi:hypothetical protein